MRRRKKAKRFCRRGHDAIGVAMASPLCSSVIYRGLQFVARQSKVPAGAKSSGGMHGVIDTDKGAIEIEFFAADYPKAVENFRLLAEHGYYDSLTFHRIVPRMHDPGRRPRR